MSDNTRFLTLINHGAKPIKGAGNQDGLLPLKMDCWEKQKAGAMVHHVGRLIVNSGAPYAQIFRDLPNEVAGRLEPIPEGVYHPGPLEFASGVWGDYSVNFPEVQSPIWQVIHRTRSIGNHLDGNRVWAPGSAACPVFRTMGDVKIFVGWFQGDPYRMTSIWVDWWNVGRVNLPPGIQELLDRLK